MLYTPSSPVVPIRPPARSLLAVTGSGLCQCVKTAILSPDCQHKSPTPNPLHLQQSIKHFSMYQRQSVISRYDATTLAE